ncbi:tRNA processing endoribonuclease [Phlyctema vagabunda]|uniref:ribonuclease Z n=1 Tax=Phlyctema vagabunda TaxID=108571 RepID=A0ABR4PN17_9HELO
MANPGVKSRGQSWVQIVSTQTADTPGTTIVLHFDNKRYLFGQLAEGTQRACVQRKVRTQNLEHLFLTGTVGWGNAGGLLGMILTLADQTSNARAEIAKTKRDKNAKKGIVEAAGPEEKDFLNIFGGKNLTHLLCTARRFVFRKGMPINTTEVLSGGSLKQDDWNPTWQDDNIMVWAMAVEPEIQPMSPRKRSHEEISSAELITGSSQAIAAGNNSASDDEMRQAVLASMFDSDWRLDSLVTMKLSQVKLPAAIFFRNSEGKIQKYDGPKFDHSEHSVPDIDVLVRNPWPGALIESLPSTTPSKSSVSYIIKNYPQRGKFDPKTARSLKVKPGPNFGKLTNGESVLAEDGSTVTPDMVIGPTIPGTGFAIFEIPDVTYILPTISRKEWSAKEVMEGVGAIIWVLGPGVLADPRFVKFMKDHDKLEHIVSSPDCCSNFIALESPASAAIRLHLVDKERFPIPKFKNFIDGGLNEADRSLYEVARPGKAIQLMPKIEVQDKSVVPYLDTVEVVKGASAEVAELAAIAQAEVSTPEYRRKLDEQQSDMPGKDVEVTTLGTGSAMPSKYRNVSATLVRVPGCGSYLFDCGENTLGQLKRVFGDELPDVLRDLKAIWISHLHADHHLGTASVIKAWDTTTKNDPVQRKLLVSSDEAMLSWIREYSEVEDLGLDRLDLVAIKRRDGFAHHMSPEQATAFGIDAIRAVPVVHCNKALACVFDFPNGFKVAYSGDCRPSRDFAEIGYGATLLIHEATFDDELRGDAMAKKHSTTSEALDVGRRMNARRILLTHFSQRYQKIPVMNVDDDKDQVAIVAFDYMRVKLADFAKLGSFRPALLKLYENEVDQ